MSAKAEPSSECSEQDFQEVENDGFEVGGISTSSDRLAIDLTHNGTRFVLVMLEPSDEDDNDDNVVLQWLHKAEEARMDRDEMVFHRCLEDMRDSAISACKNMIYMLSSSTTTSGQGSRSLEDFLRPTTIYLQLVSKDGHLQPLRMSDATDIASMYEPCFFAAESFPSMEQTLIRAADLKFIQDLYIGQVLKVSNGDDICVFKMAHGGNEDQLKREIQILQQISARWEPNDHLRPNVPRILGVVTSGDEIAGMLEEFIDGKRLSEFEVEEVSIEQRGEWKRQIQQTVSLLHQNKLIWGDTKPDNVLIDKEARAWLIDFGGSWTEGWVDENLADTMEGDLQGLDRLVQFLGFQI